MGKPLSVAAAAPLVAACGDGATGPEPALELVGPNVWNITVAPMTGADICYYHWVIQMVGPTGSYADLLDGTIVLLSGGISTPGDTIYGWTSESIKPLFGGSARITQGERRESNSYATSGSDMKPFQARVTFRYRVNGESIKEVSQDMSCTR